MVRLAQAIGLGPRSGWRAYLDNVVLILLCLLPVLLYVPVLGAPFERDESVYATIARGLLNGDVPYRDLFDNKPPLVFGWYAFSFIVFGENDVAPRLVAALLLSLTTLVVFAEARLLFSRRLAYAAAAGFAMSTGLPLVALHSNTEAYMLLPMVASLLTFTMGMRSGRLGWFLAAGVLGALAVMTKQVAIWNLAALALTAIAWRWRSGEPVAGRAAPLVFLATGAAGAMALIATPFFAVGALGDMAYANVSYNRLYIAALTFGDRALNLAQGGAFVLAIAGPLIGAAVLGLIKVLLKGRRAVDYLLVVWAVTSIAGVAMAGRFYPHYFLHAVPAAAILAAVLSVEYFPGSGRRRIARPVLVAAAALTVLAIAVNGALYLAPWRSQLRVAPSVFYQSQWAENSELLGAYIAARTSPGDTIFNLGRESQIYFYADRRPAARYFYDYVYEYDEETVRVTVEELRAERPVYVIDSMQPPLFPPAHRPAAFEELLDEEYVYEGRVYFADVYRLRGR
jgi:4-amino-4-deoxy-L-arabinose transferase-like glycosyltransferase